MQYTAQISRVTLAAFSFLQEVKLKRFSVSIRLRPEQKLKKKKKKGTGESETIERKDIYSRYYRNTL